MGRRQLQSRRRHAQGHYLAMSELMKDPKLQGLMGDMADAFEAVAKKTFEDLDASYRAGKFVQAAADRGLLLVPAGADVVRFVPPLVVKAEQIDAALGILEECLAEA